MIQSTGDPSWVKYVKDRIKKKKNFLSLHVGPTGSGKSYSALSFGLQLDKDFGPDRVVMSMRELMQLINDKGSKLKPGSVILWDEAGIDASNRNWQGITNKLINFLLQTFRHKRFILLMTVPYMDFVDANTRKLFHAEFTCLSIDYKTKTAKVKPQLIQYNSRNKKFYYKYLRIRTLRGASPVKAWNIHAPPQWLIELYEDKKNEFTAKLNKDILTQLDTIEKRKDSAQEREELTPLQEKTLKLMAQYKDAELVAEQMGLTSRTIYFHISQAKKKSYNVEEFEITPKKEVKSPKIALSS